MTTFTLIEDGTWSGGGSSLLRNVSYAVERHSEFFGDGGMPIIFRNVVSLAMLKHPFVYIPQNAWAWHGPARYSEISRRSMLRAGSELAMKRCAGYIRIGPMIPRGPRATQRMLSNVLDSAFDDALAELDPNAESSNQILAPGSLTSYRNLGALLDAFALYRADGGTCELAIVGPTGDQRVLAGIEEHAARVGHVTIETPGIGRSELIRRMAQAPAVVFPSTVEASPVTVREALALGHAPICWDSPGYRHILEANAAESSQLVASPRQLADSIHLSQESTNAPQALEAPERRAAERDRWADEFVECLVAATERPRSSRRVQVLDALATSSKLLGVTKLKQKTGAETCSIRVLNYHDVAPQDVPEFRRQIAWLTERFDFAALDDMQKVLAGQAPGDRPLVAVTFDDGLHSQATVVPAVLDEFDVPGWFFVPTAAPSVETAEQYEWAVEHQILDRSSRFRSGEPVFGDWPTWRQVAKRHVVASHTHNHVRFGADVDADQVRDELTASFDTLATELEAKERIFCWVGGEERSYSAHAAEEIRRCGVELAFTTCSLPVTSTTSPLRLERTNVEAWFTPARFEFALSGLVDARYRGKRQRLDAVLGDPS